MQIAPAEVENGTQLEIIQSLSERLRACYVLPEVAEQICARLREHWEAGDYAELAEGRLFALALTLDMQEVNHDQHLWVRWHDQPLPDGESLRECPAWQEQQRLEAQLENFGLHKVEMLRGNIGCLDIRHFQRAEWGSETVAAAMSFLAGASALIFDLRKCAGGYPDMIALLCSYLFGEEPLHLSSIYWRDEGRIQEYWSLPEIPGQRFEREPAYVLTSRATFSGGECFAAILQTRGRATVIGDKTDGGSRPGASYRVHPHMEAFIPVGRAFDPLTGAELEGVGVSPDIAVPQEHALKAAHYMALKALLASLGGAPAARDEALAREARAAMDELLASHRICPRCGYQNTLTRTKCKNCDELLPGGP